MRVSKVWMAASILLSASLVAGPAAACGGEWIPWLEIDHRPQGVNRAEKKLEQGDYTAAAGFIIRMMPHVRQLRAKANDSVIGRAQHVLAVATVRSKGSLGVAHEVPDYARGSWLGKTEPAKNDNLNWAVDTLRQLNQLKKDDPILQTELGEGLAQLVAHHQEARAILERLAGKDLIATPQGYAALAKLRALGGDADGRQAAVERCRTMAGPAAVCNMS